MKKTIITAALLATVGVAQAATVSFTDTFGLAVTNWTHAIGANQFDSTLGTLNSATFTLTGDIVQRLKAENTGAVPDALTPVAGANFLFRKNATTLQTLSLSNTGASFNATAFDGISDFAGTSGIDFGTLTASGALTFTLAGADLADLIGTGTLGNLFNVRAVGNGSINSENGNLDSSISTQARYNLAVAYDYTATPVTNNVPEPASLALIAVGLLGAGAARRRKAA